MSYEKWQVQNFRYILHLHRAIRPKSLYSSTMTSLYLVYLMEINYLLDFFDTWRLICDENET